MVADTYSFVEQHNIRPAEGEDAEDAAMAFAELAEPGNELHPAKRTASPSASGERGFLLRAAKDGKTYRGDSLFVVKVPHKRGRDGAGELAEPPDINEEADAGVPDEGDDTSRDKCLEGKRHPPTTHTRHSHKSF